MPNPASAPDLQKLRSEELRRRALEGDPQAQVVVIEVRPVTETPLVVRPQGKDARPSMGMAFLPAGPRGDPVLPRVRAQIEKITGQKVLSAFASSNAIVVEVTGADLRRIAQLPDVIAVYPNETA